MSSSEELYQEVILDHARHPRNRGRLLACSHQGAGRNPLCGDEVTVYVTLDGDRIEKVTFEGQGCAVSTASASLMTERLPGMRIDEVEALFRQVRALVSGESVAYEPALEKLEVLSGVGRFPMRVKCATLPWHAVRAALMAPPVARSENG